MKDHRLIINRKNSGFGFTSVESETQNQQLKCKIDVCLADSEDSPCSSGCFGTGWNNITFNVIASNFVSAFTQWSDWSECSVSCGGGSRERSRQCTEKCDNVIPDDLLQTEDCGIDECPIDSECISYRPNIHCQGEVMQSTRLSSDIYKSELAIGYDTEAYFGKCASFCLGSVPTGSRTVKPGSVSFNWKVNSQADDTGVCECLRSVFEFEIISYCNHRRVVGVCFENVLKRCKKL